MKRISVFLCTFSILLSLFGTIYGQTTVSGNVCGIWTTENSPYLVNSDIVIPCDDSLIIERGVTVIFQSYYSMVIHGKILALGSIEDTILFTVQDTTGFHNGPFSAGSWKGIDINQCQEAGSLFNYCCFEYAKGDEEDCGGAMDIQMITAELEIRNCSFRNNRSWIGGALYMDGAYVKGNLYVRNSSFENNRAFNGGGACLWSYNRLKELSNCRFSGNYAELMGGGLTIEASEMLNCIFTDNSCDSLGGGVWIGGGTSLKLYNCIFESNFSKHGGAYYMPHGSFNSGLYNCTFHGNLSPESIVYIGDNAVYNFEIWNSVFWNIGTGEILVEDLSSLGGIENSIIRNGSDSAWFSSSCLDSDPLLEDPEFGNYSPTMGSPCIDQGNDNSLPNHILTDAMIRLRHSDGDEDGLSQVDIGAVEYNSADATPSVSRILLDDSVCIESEYSFSIEAYPPEQELWYEWFHNGNFLEKTSRILNFDQLGNEHAGYYYCKISNAYTEILSDVALLEILSLPQKPELPVFMDHDTANALSFYYVSDPGINHEYNWMLEPEDAGALVFEDTLASILWNPSFNNIAQLYIINNQGKCQSISDTLNIESIEEPSGIDYYEATQCKIYPNPSNGFINIQLKENLELPIWVSVFNTLGSNVLEFEIVDLTTSMDLELRGGLYIIKFKTRNESSFSKSLLLNAKY